MTASELLAYSDPLGRPTELIRGRVVVLDFNGFEHGRVCVRLGAAIFTHADGLARSTGFERGDVALGVGCWIERAPDTVRAPDIIYIAADQVPPQPVFGFPEFAPTIAIDVLSPTDRPRAVRTKVTQLLRAGTALVWVVDPQRRTVHVHRAGMAVQVLGPDDTLDAEPVLPGFALRLATVFRSTAAT